MPVKLIFICALFATQNAFAQEDVWTSYFGIQSEKAPWAGFVRGIGLRHTGTSLLAEDNSIQTDKVASLTSIVVNHIKNKDIIIPVGGLGSARKQERVDAFIDEDDIRGFILHMGSIGLIDCSESRIRSSNSCYKKSNEESRS